MTKHVKTTLMENDASHRTSITTHHEKMVLHMLLRIRIMHEHTCCIRPLPNPELAHPLFVLCWERLVHQSSVYFTVQKRRGEDNGFALLWSDFDLKL